MTKITFEKINRTHQDIVFSWLEEPHVKEFWDSTQAHKDDIINFIEGRKTPSAYAQGKYTYWVALYDGESFAMLMTIQDTPQDDIGDLKLSNLSKTGHTYSIDYMIGNTKYFGKGYGARTLMEFMDYFRESFDSKADTFLIDPETNNPRAKHIYMKAGFEYIADFIMEGDCSGAGRPHHLLVRKFHLKSLCGHFNIGELICEPSRVYGGLLHKMWCIETKQGIYAVKQLSEDIDLTDNRIMTNYELSEQIACRFAKQGIRTVHAIDKFSKHLFIEHGVGYLVYPWIDAKPLSKDVINEGKALKVAAILAKMHIANLKVPEILEPQFDVHADDEIILLAKKSAEYSCAFANDFNIYLEDILKLNKQYKEAIGILKNQVVVSHGDLDQKNVLWSDSEEAILIDWESARKLNPTYEIVNVALDWSGIAGQLDQKLFQRMIETYEKAGGTIDADAFKASFYGVLGNQINWLIYNINRACDGEDLEQKAMGNEQVLRVLPTIMRLQSVVSELV